MTDAPPLPPHPVSLPDAVAARVGATSESASDSSVRRNLSSASVGSELPLLTSVSASDGPGGSPKPLSPLNPASRAVGARLPRERRQTIGVPRRRRELVAPGDLRSTRSGTNASRVSSLGEASPAGGQQAAVEAAANVVAAGRRASEGNAAHPSAKGGSARPKRALPTPVSPAPPSPAEAAPAPAPASSASDESDRHAPPSGGVVATAVPTRVARDELMKRRRSLESAYAAADKVSAMLAAQSASAGATNDSSATRPRRDLPGDGVAAGGAGDDAVVNDFARAPDDAVEQAAPPGHRRPHVIKRHNRARLDTPPSVPYVEEANPGDADSGSGSGGGGGGVPVRRGYSGGARGTTQLRIGTGRFSSGAPRATRATIDGAPGLEGDGPGANGQIGGPEPKPKSSSLPNDSPLGAAVSFSNSYGQMQFSPPDALSSISLSSGNGGRRLYDFSLFDAIPEDDGPLSPTSPVFESDPEGVAVKAAAAAAAAEGGPWGRDGRVSSPALGTDREATQEVLGRSKANLATLVKFVQRYTKAERECEAASRALADFLKEFGESELDNPALVSNHLRLGETLLRVGNVFAAMESSREHYAAQFTRAVEKPQARVNDEISRSKRLHHEWRKARTNVDKTTATVAEALNRKTINYAKLSAQGLEHAAAQMAYGRLSEESAEANDDVERVKEFALNRMMLELIDTKRTYHSTELQHLDNLAVALERTFEHAVAKEEERRERARGREERAALREYSEAHSLPLVHLLARPDLVMLDAMLKVLEVKQNVDYVLESVVRVLDAHGLVVPLVKDIIANQVEATAMEATLFRSNTIRTRLITSFAKCTGKEYLKKVFKPLIIDVLDLDRELEVDPGKVNDNTMLDLNLDTLMGIVRQFIEVTINSREEVPVSFKIVCNQLQQSVADKWPDSPDVRHTAVGGFYFLRYICPALASPHTHALCEVEPEKHVMRNLLQISKTLQNLSNGSRYSMRRPHMVKMDSLMDDYQETINSFFDDLATLSPAEAETHEPLLTVEDASLSDVPVLTQLLMENIDGLMRFLVEHKQNDVIYALCSVLWDKQDHSMGPTP